MDRQAQAWTGGPISLGRALEVFDASQSVQVEEALGRWRGQVLSTGHAWEGLLEAYGWFGKRFDGPDTAHPLVFTDRRGTYAVNPALLPLGMVTTLGRAACHPIIARAGRLGLRAARTREPRARLRMIEHRGVVSAAMVYDALPVIDHFRRVDDHRMIGVMDMRGMADPLVFVLVRDDGAH